MEIDDCRSAARGVDFPLLRRAGQATIVAMSDPLALLGQFGALALGACVGSFLNVCIYRWPRNLTVHEPARSFCPACKHPIPLWQNIPLVSWLVLRGRCAACKARIPFRYFLVEALTAVAFLLVWRAFPPGAAVAYAVLASACLVTVFVDSEHYVIPDQVTWKLLPVGLLASAFWPEIHVSVWPAVAKETLWWRGLAMSVVGAASGYALLWLVVEGGKKLFGRKARAFPSPVDWELRETDAGPELVVDGEAMAWDDIFNRPSDRLELHGDQIRLDGRSEAADTVVFAWDHLELRQGRKEGRTVKLEAVKTMAGRATRLVIPREAMGTGDVKFLAMAGAFVGWQGVLFTVFAASVLGAAFGLLSLALGRRDWMGRIPFGPWLVAGVWAWVICGPTLAGWYLDLTGLRPAVLF